MTINNQNRKQYNKETINRLEEGLQLITKRGSTLGKWPTDSTGSTQTL